MQEFKGNMTSSEKLKKKTFYSAEFADVLKDLFMW